MCDPLSLLAGAPSLGVVRELVDYLLHMDDHLARLVEQLGAWVYAIISVTVFAETGLVVTPWLPGESLLLGCGTLAGGGLLSILLLAPLLLAAAFLGDLSNYLIGRLVGRRLLSKPRRYLRPEHVARAHEFYQRHGGLAIVLARFMPVVRSLAPFAAGVAKMDFRRLLFFDGLASVLWVTIFLGGGYWFGTVPWVAENLALVLAGVVFASVLPSIVAFVIRRSRGLGR